jgi:hypothetical protein
MANIGAQASPHGWSTTASNNGNQATPDGLPTLSNPSLLYGYLWEIQRAVRTFYNGPEWVEYGQGDQGYTPAFVSATSFSIATDVHAEYHPNRRVKVVAPTPGTIYGTITASSFAAGVTTVTVVWDSGSLSNEAITSVYLGTIPGDSSLLSSLPNIKFPALGVTTISQSNVETARFNASGQLLVGQTAATASNASLVQVAGLSGTAGVLANKFAADANPAILAMSKSRGATINSNAALSSGDEVGRIAFYGQDGTNYQTPAQISAWVDAAVSAGKVPGRLTFSTTTNGGTLTEAARINDAQQVLIGQTGLVGSSTAVLQVAGTGGAGNIQITEDSNDATAAALTFVKTRATTPTGVTAVAQNDNCMTLNVFGTDGTGYVEMAAIGAWVDGTVATGKVPSRLTFDTMTSAGVLNEAFRVASTQQVLFNNPTIEAAAGSISSHSVQISSTTGAPLGLFEYSADTAAIGLTASKSRNATIGSHTAVQSGDGLLSLTGQGSDGTNFQYAGQFAFLCDGTVSAGVVPGRCIIATANSSGTLTEAMRIDSSQHVLAQATAAQTPASSTAVGATLWDAVNERMVLSNGTSGTITNSVLLVQNGIAPITNSGGLLAFFRGTTTCGSITATSTLTSYNTSSDINLKTEIATPIMRPLLDQVDARQFKFKSDIAALGDVAAPVRLGFVAQEIQVVLPQAVTAADDGTLQMDYSKVTPVIWGALKETRADLAAAKADIAAIKTKLGM